MPPLRRSMRRTARRTARRTSRRQEMFYNEPQSEETSAPEEGGTDYTEELEKLARLKEEGVISEEEYTAKKKQILDL